MIITACTPYFKELIQRSDKEDTVMLFQAACKVLAPQLHNIDAASFCREIGVADDYIPLFHQYIKQ